jgi:hypothetical protein
MEPTENQKKYHLDAGRCIMRDGVAIATVHGVRPDGWRYTLGSASAVDDFAHEIVRALNELSDGK